jgi:carbamoyl-phosphate synthase small subunit
MTCAEIGNVGTNAEDFESDRIQAAGLIVRSSRPAPSSWRSEQSLRELLSAQNVVAVEGIDTRALVLHIREQGAQMGCISTEVSDVDALIERARSSGSMVGRDLASRVTCKETYRFERAPSELHGLGVEATSKRPNVVVYDLGVKRSILMRLVERGANLTVVPASTPADQVLGMNPDGVVFSNGPGDPEAVKPAIEAAKKIVGKKPVLGICLGHQILGLAYGAKTFKLKFGHRGSNQPVRHEPSGRVMITSQNHGFAIDPKSFPSQTAELTEYNLNDQTLAGFEVPRDRVLAVQYHPEASPGPHDASDHFGRFVRMCLDG